MRFVDSNIFVYVLAGDPKYGEVAKDILKRIEDGEEAATSTLVITQVCSYLRWRKRSSVIPLFLRLLKSLAGLEKINTRFEDFDRALKLIDKYKLDWRIWDDVVIAIQMRRNNIYEIYSNDEDFDRIPGVRRVFE